MKALKFFIVFLLLTGGFAFYTMLSTGFFRKVPPFEGNPLSSFQLPGVEDLALSKKDSFMILSSDDRAARREGETKNGGLYYLDLKNKDSSPMLLTGLIDRPFYPHGISMYPIDDATYRVWAINHPEVNLHQIEVFDLVADSLIFIKTITDPKLISPNDLVAIDTSSFFVTNDHGFSSKLGLLAENYLGLSVANVSFYDGSEFFTRAKGISYANGITYDFQRRLLYVASPRSFSIKVYDVLDDSKLVHKEDLEVGTGIDNLYLDEKGALWTGGHPNLLKFTSYANGNSAEAPSEAIKVTYVKEGNWSVEQLFTDDGRLLSGASVAVPWGKQLFIGNVMDEELIVIDLKSKNPGQRPGF